MVDPVGIIKNIFKAAKQIHSIVLKVRAFNELANNLNEKVILLEPGLTQLEKITPERDIYKEDPVYIYAEALKKMLDCVTDVHQFIEKLKGMPVEEKALKALAGTVEEEYNKLDKRLDVLREGIMFNMQVLIIVEVRAALREQAAAGAAIGGFEGYGGSVGIIGGADIPKGIPIQPQPIWETQEVVMVNEKLTYETLRENILGKRDELQKLVAEL